VGYYSGRASPADVKQALRRKLPEYMIPGVLVNLEEMPQLPNGKVDRKLLAAKPVSLGTGSEEQPRTETEAALARLMAEVLGVRTVGLNDNFFDLGGHSLLAVKFTAKLESTLGCKLLPSVLFQAPSVGALARLIVERESSQFGLGLVPLHSLEGGVPLFCVHGMDGSVWLYRPLVRHLGTFSVYGIEARDLRGDNALTMEEIARRHILTLKTAQPNGPYRLAGYSYGGAVAFEMARQLLEQGEQVALLAVIDSSAYSFRGAWSQTELFGSFIHRVGLRLASFIKREGTPLVSYAKGKPRLWAGKIRRLFMKKEDRFSDWLPGPITPAQSDLVSVLGTAWEHYTPKPYSGDMVLFRSQIRDVTDYDFYAGWKKFVRGKIEVVSVPGDHFTMLEVHAETLAKELALRAMHGRP
jgi:thioesterase domain-containing protein/acyl carrier protein